MADQETVEQATADQETAAPAMETDTAVGTSTEEAFFERSIGSSDPPVSFDIEPDDAPFDFESREERRAYFKRVVGGIIATLGVGSLLALTRPGPRPPEPLPAAANPEPPSQTLEFEPIVEVAPAEVPSASVAVAPAPSAAPSASARSVQRAPSSAPAPRVFVPPPATIQNP